MPLMEPAVNQWLTIQALADERENPASRFQQKSSIIEEISLLGYDDALEWEQTPQGLRLFMPSVAADLPLVVKLTALNLDEKMRLGQKS